MPDRLAFPKCIRGSKKMLDGYDPHYLHPHRKNYYCNLFEHLSALVIGQPSNKVPNAVLAYESLSTYQKRFA